MSFSSSRICVKGLPKYVAEDRLKEFFSKRGGQVTDAKLIRTKDGKSRQFAFIGFRTEREAEEAIKYFNNSYMDTCRITCEIALKIGDPHIPPSRSRYSAKKQEGLNGEQKESPSGKSLSLLEPKVESMKSKNSNDGNDFQLQEFLQVMQCQSKLWANDTVGILGKNNKTILKNCQSQKGSKKESLSKQDELDELGNEFTGIHSATKSHDPALNEGLADMDNFSGRLFVHNLPYTATEDDLTELFQKFGDLLGVHLVLDKDTKRSKGFAYILYALRESAVRALENLDQLTFQGRLLNVLPAKQQNSSEKQEDKSFKKQREDHRKASEASGDMRAWNCLFTRIDTALEYISRINGVRKSDLLDREADDLAVLTALGETKAIADTKQALLSSGVNVCALEEFVSGKFNGATRSNHVVLVKNLPYGSSEGDIARMFGKYGSIDKIILPPTNTLALVVFLEVAEARAAFKALAYKRYKDAPLYLEWAPDNILSSTSKSGNDAQNKVIVGEQDVKSGLLGQLLEGISDEDIDPDRVESRSLYVKNLNFKTSDENLRKHFSEKMGGGSIYSVKIKKHLKNGKKVSTGFGFIEFDSVETAANVCRDVQRTILDGHDLRLQVCHAKDEQMLKKVEDKSKTKLIVRNVAFEATKKDLRQLFSPFGQIKSLRLPMKFGKHRGFAFVEFITKQEAQSAVQALSSTHLYGRHLVLEQAKESESLEELRARTAVQFTDEQNGFETQSKLSKKRKHTIDHENNFKFQKIVG